MSVAIKELPELKVFVRDVVYMPNLDAPEDRPHPFVYYISIKNESQGPLRIRGRKWVVTDLEGNTTVVEGEGVVSQQPNIEPEQEFSYNSYHVIGCDSFAEGAFFAEQPDGQVVFTRIPRFEMKVPQWA
ncbi:MAG: ApaG domain [Verrucomicrobiota bacterium]